jgi:hypothetical protein
MRTSIFLVADEARLGTKVMLFFLPKTRGNTMQYTSRPANLWTNVLLASFLLTIFAACDQSGIHVDDDNAMVNASGVHIPVVEGRLAFRDIEAFGNFMDVLVSSDAASLDELAARDGFTSLRTATEQLADEVAGTLGDVEVAERVEIVEDPYFAAVLNKEGEVQVGSDVVKVTRNYVYRAPQSSVESLKDIELRNADYTPVLSKQSDGPAVEAVEIKRTVYAAGPSAGKTMVSRSCTSYFTSTRRVHGKSWITDYWLYAAAGTRTKSQRKTWRWRSNNVQQVRIESEYSLTDSDGNTSEDTYDHSIYNGNELEVVFMTDSGWSATITGDMDTEHSAKRSNVWRSCNTVVSR